MLDEEIERFLPDLSAEPTDSVAYTANPTPYPSLIIKAIKRLRDYALYNPAKAEDPLTCWSSEFYRLATC